MLDMRVGMHAELPTAQVEPSAKIRVFIITAAKFGVEATDLKKNSAPHQERVASKTMRTDVAPGLAHISVQVIPGIIVAGGSNDRKLRISHKRFTQPRQKVLGYHRIGVEHQ